MAENENHDPNTAFKAVAYTAMGFILLATAGTVGVGKGMEQAQREGIDCKLDESFAKAVAAQIASGDLSVKVAANQDGQCRLKVTTAENGYMP